jgi:hypothetical protein
MREDERRDVMKHASHTSAIGWEQWLFQITSYQRVVLLAIFRARVRH